ncbi:MAG: DUF1670 domain-containing protein [Nitrospiraceae bacterium]|nr:DUF1670 domain-containing protein [Nitrospiraceae bacterium]
MSRKPDYVRKHYGPLLQKTLQNAVSHVIGEQFPRIGGPRIRELCARMILDVVDAHVRPTEHLRHGQALWLGIATNDPPRRRQRTADTKLVPVALDLSTPEDIHARLDRKSSRERLRIKAVRLWEQAHQQGALLSNSDLSELPGSHDSTISGVLVEHETQTGRLVPRRATLHEVGTGLTHKRIICWKRYAEGKSCDVVARETYHSLEAVYRYLGQFDRVRHCRGEGMSPEKTAFALNCGVALVNEYLAIDRALEGGNPC